MMLTASWGGLHTHKSQCRRKIHEKKRQRPWTFIFKVPWKFSEETYETIFETLRAQFLILLCEISYGSKILSTETKSSIIIALGALHKRLKSPDLAFFELFVVTQALNIWLCAVVLLITKTWNLVSRYGLNTTIPL